MFGHFMVKRVPGDGNCLFRAVALLRESDESLHCTQWKKHPWGMCED
jgi:hypothetical protein